MCSTAVRRLFQAFGSEPIESIDKCALQTHLNNLAGTYSQDRVKQARSYLKSIFDEAIEQEFLVKIHPEAEKSQESSTEGQADFDLGSAEGSTGQGDPS
jgi:hypothetical protein